MSRGDRFRRLGRRTTEADARAGDLFEHFGVETESPPAAAVEHPEARAAAPCPRCAWFVVVGEAACPNCAEPQSNPDAQP